MTATTSTDGADDLFGDGGDDHLYFDIAEARLATSVLNGGAGIDTLHLDFTQGGIHTLTGRPTGMNSIERLDIRTGRPRTGPGRSAPCAMSPRPTRCGSKATSATTSGLQDDVTGDALTGGDWVEGVTAYAGGENWTHYDYVLNGVVRASVSIDTDVNVYLI